MNRKEYKKMLEAFSDDEQFCGACDAPKPELKYFIYDYMTAEFYCFNCFFDRYYYFLCDDISSLDGYFFGGFDEEKNLIKEEIKNIKSVWKQYKKGQNKIIGKIIKEQKVELKKMTKERKIEIKSWIKK